MSGWKSEIDRQSFALGMATAFCECVSVECKRGGQRMLNITSNITFLYFIDLEAAKRFVSGALGLDVAYDPGWACVYRLGETSFLGLVDDRQGSVAGKSRDGVLVSLTVEDIEAAHSAMEAFGVDGLSEIKQVKDIALSSFFFTGPEGYRFEIQHFTSGELKAIF